MGSTKVGKKLDGISEQKAVRKTKRKANGKEKQKNEETEELLKDNVEEDVKPMISEKKTNEGGKGGSQQDEYEYDSSDEEDLRNTIGNIPIKWYDDEEHIGYDKIGNKIAKPKKKGEIDTFLEKMEDPDYWRKVFDRQTGTDVTLTEGQVERIKNMSSGKYPQIGYNPYEPFLDLYSSEKMIHPIDNIPEPKSRFVPSKQEMQKVSKLVHAIKMGWLKPPQEKEEPKPYDLWASEDSSSSLTKSQIARMRVHMPAPKMPLPVHNESYNPPEEYLLDEKEKKKWKETEPEDRPANYIPEKFDSYRRVPQYKEFLSERYDRCLDLYLAPRKIKNKMQVTDPSQLLPDLPNPNDLKPFPTTLAFYMRGHSGQVRSISMEPEKGELMASGGADGTVKIWMVDTGRCVKTFKMEGPVTSVAFCPNAEFTLLAVSYEGHQIALLNTGCGDRLLVANTEKFLKELPIGEVESQIDWRRNRERVILKMPNEVRRVVWHQKGDYFASVAIADIASSVYIHQLSKAKSQCPFRKRKGHVQTVGFHPIKPHLFVATKVSIRYYDLARCILLKKCSPGTAHVGAIAYDHTGDNLFVGGLDRKFSWLDLQLSNKPWKKFRHHRSAIRGVVFHKRYPLLATVSDDGSAMIYYVRIYTDSSRDNEIYPVKRLYPHQVADGLSVLDVAWHPTQPWLLTAGADGTVALFSS